MVWRCPYALTTGATHRNAGQPGLLRGRGIGSYRRRLPLFTNAARMVCAPRTSSEGLWLSGYVLRPLIAELVLATQPNISVEQCAALLQRIAETPSLYDTARDATDRFRQWVEWGGRGWLGAYLAVSWRGANLDCRHFPQLRLLDYF